MSVIDRYTVADLREMANAVHDAGLGARGQGLYALLLGLALEKEKPDIPRNAIEARQQSRIPFPAKWWGATDG